jgi:Icc-related predicted phosphoesterase
MKILHISDVHSEENENFYKYLDENSVDLVIVSGDITNFGSAEFATGFLNKVSSKVEEVIAIIGNCDPEEVLFAVEESDAFLAHNTITIFKNLIIYGFGGSNPTPFNTPFEINEDVLYESINNLIEHEEVVLEDIPSLKSSNPLKILLTHAPPLNSQADKIDSGDHVGSSSIERIIKENNFDLNLCGHIHEARSISKIGDTIVANPGILTGNHGVLIDVKEDSSFNCEIVDFS